MPVVIFDKMFENFEFLLQGAGKGKWWAIM